MNKRTKIRVATWSVMGIVVVFAAVYFLILPPQVVDTLPEEGSDNVPLNSLLITRFDKPIKRQELTHIIVPEAHGEWTFEDPLLKNHLYRTVVFTPAVEFEPDTKYTVEFRNVESPFGLGSSGDFSFSFTTVAVSPGSLPAGGEAISPTGEEADKEGLAEKVECQQGCALSEPGLKTVEPSPQITMLDIAMDWQDHPLSCEAASLKMALNFKGVEISEEEIMAKIGVDLTVRENDIWGDPYQEYVGKVDGKICQTGYGVYWGPVAAAASNWREAEAIFGWNLQGLLREVRLGNPVIVWGTMPTTSLTDCSWYTKEGKYIKAFRETHVRVVIGYIGALNNPSKIILNDPLNGRLYWPTDYFLSNWQVFDRSAVVVR